jgi:hypothetical protein
LLLATAGDNPNISALAPFVPSETQERMRDIGRALLEYKFGHTRYRRTKVLSWISAILLEPSADANGVFAVRSTASHINALFQSLQDSDRPDHALRSTPALLKLLEALHRGIQAHSETSWPEKFKDNDKGEKWQELQLVASLTGTILIGMLDADAVATLEGQATAIAKFLRENPRPLKTQNKDQWIYIGRIALGLLEICGVDLATLGTTLTGVFGFNCLVTLGAARDRQ